MTKSILLIILLSIDGINSSNLTVKNIYNGTKVINAVLLNFLFITESWKQCINGFHKNINSSVHWIFIRTPWGRCIYTPTSHIDPPLHALIKDVLQVNNMGLEKLIVVTELMSWKHGPQISSNWNWPLQSLFFGRCSQQVSGIWPQNKTIGQQPLSHSSRRGYTIYCQLSWFLGESTPQNPTSKSPRLSSFFPRPLRDRL